MKKEIDINPSITHQVNRIVPVSARSRTDQMVSLAYEMGVELVLQQLAYQAYMKFREVGCGPQQGLIDDHHGAFEDAIFALLKIKSISRSAALKGHLDKMSDSFGEAAFMIGEDAYAAGFMAGWKFSQESPEV
ncbi:hypothetical protein BBD42_27035 [Paenibacillus sp. BIHB 4019]|uniref:Uncharacterized protein n=1 Tax=Paenibacillus sp. BIHB 4019 TaxID=1870819 RepID=A0A1B2DPW6_9BACL|nr:hypothetical protein [Paenibacillus sp. BIHB 4019]ANY69739.1 hypothetical protein BBD42_27035 [Paenibacillus sp. BIHB 4019]